MHWFLIQSVQNPEPSIRMSGCLWREGAVATCRGISNQTGTMELRDSICWIGSFLSPSFLCLSLVSLIFCLTFSLVCLPPPVSSPPPLPLAFCHTLGCSSLLSPITSIPWGHRLIDLRLSLGVMFRFLIKGKLSYYTLLQKSICLLGH